MTSRRRRPVPKPLPAPKPVKVRRGSVSLLVPFAPDSGARDSNWRWLRERWERNHPGIEIVEGSCDGPWSKGRALADAVARSHGDTLIVADADVMPHPDAIGEALQIVHDATWVVPHTRVIRLDELGTKWVLGCDGEPATADLMSLPLEPGRRPHDGVAGGGVVVLTRDAFNRCPLDHRFVGWGEEDYSWGWALDTLVGAHTRLGADLWHLWHPRQPNHRHPAPASKALCQQYRDALGAPRLMEAIVFDRPPAPPERTGTAVFRTERTSLLLHVGGKRAKFVGGVFATADPDLADQLRARPDITEVT